MVYWLCVICIYYYTREDAQEEKNRKKREKEKEKEKGRKRNESRRLVYNKEEWSKQYHMSPSLESR